MQILDGKLASQAIKEDLAHKISLLKAQAKKIPHLAAILVGSNAGKRNLRGFKSKELQSNRNHINLIPV